jgi:hypothetical protein
MTHVTRGQFKERLSNGVDLGKAEVAQRLQGTGVTLEDLRTADLNGDGRISGQREVARAYKLADDFDHNGTRRSFRNQGEAGAVFGALTAGVAPRTERGGAEAIVHATADRVRTHGPGYAKAAAPTSPLKRLSGNHVPGETRPDWLRGQWKCNQFVGDVLTQAGFRAPTHTMKNGSLHYAAAEEWPHRKDLFDRITDPSDIRPGDVVVRERPNPTKEGRNEAGHIEIVTGTGPMRTTGAHEDGAQESNRHWLENGAFSPHQRGWMVPADNEDNRGKHDVIYVLRPKQRFVQ